VEVGVLQPLRLLAIGALPAGIGIRFCFAEHVLGKCQCQWQTAGALAPEQQQGMGHAAALPHPHKIALGSFLSGYVFK
jgi:hypothetical protein